MWSKAGTGAPIQITYDSSNAADQWRCHLYAIYSRPVSLVSILLVPITAGFFFGEAFLKSDWPLFAGIEIVSIAGWLTLFALLMALQMALRTQIKPRMCTTTLTPEGFVDVTPSGSAFVPWANVKGVVCHNGDVHLWTSLGSNFIPRSAFQSVAEAQGFADAASAARRGDYSSLASPSSFTPPPIQMPAPPPGVWPPAPMPQSSIAIAPASNPPDSPGADQFQDQARRTKKKQLLQLLRSVFTVPLAVTFFMSRQHAIDPAHAQRVALLDLSVLVVCLTGLLVTWLVGRKY